MGLFFRIFALLGFVLWASSYWADTYGALLLLAQILRTISANMHRLTFQVCLLNWGIFIRSLILSQQIFPLSLSIIKAMAPISRAQWRAKYDHMKHRKIRFYKRALDRAQEMRVEAVQDLAKANEMKHQLFDQNSVLMNSMANKIREYNFLAAKHNQALADLASLKQMVEVKSAVIDGYRRVHLEAVAEGARANVA